MGYCLPKDNYQLMPIACGFFIRVLSVYNASVSVDSVERDEHIVKANLKKSF